MKFVVAMLLLALTSIAPAQAATCPQQAQLRADPRWTPRDEENCHHCIFNIVVAGPTDLLLWNGSPVTEARLATFLRRGARLDPPPVTLLLIHNGSNGADCALLARVVAAIERHGECYGDHCPFGLAPPRRPPR